MTKDKKVENIKIVPAILEDNFAEIEQKFKVVSGIVPMVQVDVCDGKFVPSVTFGAGADASDFRQLGELAESCGLDIELDMMVNISAEWLDAVLASGCTQVVFHIGSVNDWSEVFSTVEGRVKVGLGAHLDSDMREVTELLDKHNFDYVQVMGIEKVGYGGQGFSERALIKIQDIRTELPDILVSVDGGVSLSTAKCLVDAGATQFAAGSAIFKVSNPQEAIERLRQIGQAVV